VIKTHGARLRDSEIGVVLGDKWIGRGGFLQFVRVANSSRNDRIREHRTAGERGGKI